MFWVLMVLLLHARHASGECNEEDILLNMERILQVYIQMHCKKTTSHLAHKNLNMPRARTHSAWTLSTATCCSKKHSVAVESVHAE